MVTIKADEKAHEPLLSAVVERSFVRLLKIHLHAIMDRS